LIPFSSSFTPVILAELHVIFISDTGWIYISIWIYLSIYLSTHPCFYLSTGNVRLAQPAGNLDCKYVTKLLKHAVFLKHSRKTTSSIPTLCWFYPSSADRSQIFVHQTHFFTGKTSSNLHWKKHPSIQTQGVGIILRQKKNKSNVPGLCHLFRPVVPAQEWGRPEGGPTGIAEITNFLKINFIWNSEKNQWKSSRYMNQSDKSKIIKMQTSTGLGPYFHHMAKGPELRVTSKQDWNAPAIWWG
jgi:hypothetical protein